jgi:Papain family cysteine protease
MAKTARKSGKPAARASGTRKPPRTTAETRAMRGAGQLPADAIAVTDQDLDKIRVGNRRFPGKAKRLGTRKLDVLPDMPDIRDRTYRPVLRALLPAIDPQIRFEVRDQAKDSSCTGFALAHVIDFLRSRETRPGKKRQRADNRQRVSARMLYEMAKRNDEWAGSAYEGSSIRGAIKGFFRNGVCLEATAPDNPGVKDWVLTFDMAKQARETRLGAYLRVEPDISDYHAALNEIGVIYASAQIHSNWRSPKKGYIEQQGGTPQGGHAFAIVGYDEKGFWILNSWGKTWGKGGIAHWDYVDWAANIMDAWVLQLGVRAPDAFGAVPRVAPSGTSGLFGFGDPNRADIIGHFINIDDGRLVTDGKYGSPNDEEMRETVKRLTVPDANAGKGFEHLIIYAHGGLNSLPDEAKRIAVWKQNDIFARNKLYNFHLMWGSGFIDEVFGELSGSSAAGRAGGLADWLFEAGLGKETGSYAWRNMKQDARCAFDGSTDYNGGVRGLKPLLVGLDEAKTRPMLHLVGHSAGAIVLGNLLSALSRFSLGNMQLGSIHLMAPACTVEFFKVHYGPFLKGNGALQLLDKIYLYNLTNALELKDTVSANVPLLPSYSHSLLYLVSRAYEDKAGMALAGMQAFVNSMPTSPAKLAIAYSKTGGDTASTSHGGFDNDAPTLTTIMSRILRKKVPKPPTADQLTGY